MSFLEIIREQEDERLAKKIQNQNQYHDNQQYYLDDLNFAIAQSLSEQQTPILLAPYPSLAPFEAQEPLSPSKQSWSSLVTNKPNQTKEPDRPSSPIAEQDFILASIQQHLEDQELALYLQRQERLHLPGLTNEIEAKKKLSPLEYKLYQHQLEIDDEASKDQPDEEDTEYDYTEPNPSSNQLDPPVLYDPAQRREDKEISMVPKRMPEKRINSMPVALHHKDFGTDKQKRGARPLRSFRKDRPEDLSDLPRRDDNHEYGLVLRNLGGRRFKVFCYHTSSDIICWLPGKLMMTNTWIMSGQVILFRVRKYQLGRGDIVDRYEEEEYAYLRDCGELKQCDPRKHLPLDVVKKILTYLDIKSRTNFWLAYKSSTQDNI